MNKLGSRSKLLRAMKQNAYCFITYPDFTNKEIYRLITKHFGIKEEHVALGVGSTQILFDMPIFLKYKRAVIVVPTFWEYVTFNTLFRRKIKKIHFSSANDFAPNYELINKELRPGDCLFLANVNSPTSLLYEKKALLRLLDTHPNVQFVIDETYLMFRADAKNLTVTAEAAKRTNLIVLTSFSKFFSLLGIRVGAFVAHKSVVKNYNTYFHIPYSLGSLSQVALAHQLEDLPNILRSRSFYEKEQEEVYAIIQKKFAGRLHAIKPAGNFIFCRLLTGQTSKEVVLALRKKGMIVRGGHELDDLLPEQWIRFSFLSKKEDRQLLAALDCILKRST